LRNDGGPAESRGEGRARRGDVLVLLGALCGAIQAGTGEISGSAWNRRNGACPRVNASSRRTKYSIHLPDAPGDCADWSRGLPGLRNGSGADGHCGRRAGRPGVRLDAQTALGRCGGLVAAAGAFDGWRCARSSFRSRRKERDRAFAGLTCCDLGRLANGSGRRSRIAAPTCSR
jgi:hypothetical protein